MERIQKSLRWNIFYTLTPNYFKIILLFYTGKKTKMKNEKLIESHWGEIFSTHKHQITGEQLLQITGGTLLREIEAEFVYPIYIMFAIYNIFTIYNI